MKVLNSLAFAYLLFVFGLAVAMALQITMDFWHDRIPLWLGVPMLLAVAAALIGAAVNDRWRQIGRLLLMGMALLVLIACWSWMAGLFLSGSVTGPSGTPSPGQPKMVDGVTALQLGIVNAAKYYIGILFAVAAVLAWKLPATNVEKV